MTVLLYADKDHFDVYDQHMAKHSDTTRYFYEVLKDNGITAEMCFESNIEKAKTAKIILPRFEVPEPTNKEHFKNYYSFLKDLQALEDVSPDKIFWNSPTTMLNNFNKEYLSDKEVAHLLNKTIITNNISDMLDFMNSLENKDNPVIIKPRNGSKGAGIMQFFVDEFSLEKKLFNYLNFYGDNEKKIIMQEYNPYIEEEGDTRLNVIDGELVSGFTRKPKNGSITANIHTGGSAHIYAPTQREINLVNSLKPYLKKEGIGLAGVDVSGGYLMEINMLSPGGAVRADYLNKNTNTKDFFLQKIKSYLE
jgi:glutathione synthase/RimK-type ligase-like ATP-grasp enzyme